jgi:hypothetical protein
LGFLSKGWDLLNSKRILTAINLAWVAGATSLGVARPLIDTVALILAALVGGRAIEDMGKKK